MAAKKTGRSMPAFTKPTEATVKAFEAAFARTAGVERRTMFGYPSAFLNGNMMACVFQDRIMVRLAEHDRVDAQRSHGAKPFEPSPGRAMKEYVELPPSITKDGDALTPWFARAARFVAKLPGRWKAPAVAAKKSAAKKSAAKKSIAKKSTAQKATATKSTAGKSAAKRKSR
jgi:TfoX/Sxy family transcriptional regulator of competence genes